VGAVVAHDKMLSTPRSCPTATAVDHLLGTHLATLSSIRETTIFSCTYSGKTGGRALGIAAEGGIVNGDVPGTSLCEGRPSLLISGNTGCDAAGTAGTARGDASIIVNTVSRRGNRIAWQLTSYTPSITRPMLVQLAHKVVTPTPDPDV